MLPVSLLSVIVVFLSSTTSYVSGLESRQFQDSELPPLPPQSEVQPGSVVCRPFGLCEPCPPEALDQPYCQPYGNRRLIHCLPYSSLPQPGHLHGPPPPHFNTSSKADVSGETPAWEACGKVVSKELADFWEFVMCNLVFLAIAGFVYLARSRKLAAVQYRQLAARIGLTRGSGWTDG